MTNLELMNKRLQWQGGNQEQRMIKDKYRTLKKVLMFSYQGCDVQLQQKRENCEQLEDQPIYRALINPDKVKQDYDDKILSIFYETGYKCGDVFLWKGTNTRWLIYLEQLTEDAYFRGEIRLCKYQIKFKDADGKIQKTWAAIRGPVETQIETGTGLKKQVSVHSPNFTLSILLPRNDATLQMFQRYSEFLFNGKCWRVTVNDDISVTGVIEVIAEEYYIDKDTDDRTEEIKDGLVIEPVDPNGAESAIKGNTFIKPKFSERYEALPAGGTWSIKEKDMPVCLSVISDNEVSLKWQKTVSGQFTLVYKVNDETYEKIIVVESLF